MPENPEKPALAKKLPIEEWQARKNPPAWAHKAAFVGQRWCRGLCLTEADYDAALHAAQHGEIR
jgi:hypothetical protein